MFSAKGNVCVGCSGNVFVVFGQGGFVLVREGVVNTDWSGVICVGHELIDL